MDIAIVGATGRMGKLIDDVVSNLNGFDVVRRLHSTSTFDELDGADLVVDVTQPQVSPDVVSAALERNQRVLVGTSGWSQDKLDALAGQMNATDSVVVVPNFSLGAVVSEKLASLAAQYFDSIEVLEAHHAGKQDAPSGTAVRVAEQMAASRASAGLDPIAAPTLDQPGRGVAVRGIPVHAMRLVGVQAIQDVVLGGEGEVLKISHTTMSQDAYRTGIAASLRYAATHQGLTVGLDAVLGIK